MPASLARVPEAPPVDRFSPTPGYTEPTRVVDEATTEDEFSAVERDAREQIALLQADRARLSLAAMSDAKVRAEVADLESRLRAARDELERIGLARGERQRLDAEAGEAAENERRQGHMKLAAKLELKRAEAARNVDEGAHAFASAIAAYNAIWPALEQELRAAGHADPMSVRPSPWALMAALKAAFGAAGVERGFDLPPQTPAAPFAGK